jgi:hypothetical protein
MARTIQSPGVEIREVDFTIRAATVAGTYVFLPGFADQGPIDEVLQPSNITELEQIYGTPTNSAEQYFYQTAKAIFQSPARLLTTRIPYGADRGEGFSNWRYSALVYPVKGMRSDNLSYYRLDTLQIDNPGSGYLEEPSLQFVGGQVLNNEPPEYTIEWDSNTGQITDITLTKRGKYITPPTAINIIGAQTEGGVPATLGPYNFDFIVDSLPTSFKSDLNNSEAYLFGTPTHLELSFEEYQKITNGDIDWLNNPTVVSKNTPFTKDNIGSAGLIVLNKSQTTINNSFEGYYIGVIDNNNNNPATPFNGVNYVKTITTSSTAVSDNSYLNIPKGRLNFTLSAVNTEGGGSVSEVLENLSQFDLGNSTFDDTVSFGVFKIRKSIFAPDTISLDYNLAESYVGSLDYHRQIGDQTGGPAKPFYLGQLANDSGNIEVLVNPYISNRFTSTWLNSNGFPSKKVRFLSPQLAQFVNGPGYTDTDAKYIQRVGVSKEAVAQALIELGSTDALYALGIYTNTISTDKHIGNLPRKLERAFELVENPDVYQINIAVEGGLGSIYVNALAQTSGSEESAGPFVDSTPLKSLSAFYTTNAEGLSQEGLDLRSNYTSVANVFVNAAEKQRKDFLAILDPIRNIFVQGQNTKVINTKKTYSPNAGVDPTPTDPGYVTTNFSQHIYWPLRHQFSTINSSYATTYGTYAQVVDSTSSRQLWVPFSGFAAALMANTDSNFQPWFAPAGFTRGILTGVNDIGVYPKLKQRDQFYKVSINPVAFFPAEGFVVFGQKTLLKKPSAFDRINVRRLFLNLEVATRDTVKFFVFEPNTLFTRTQIINTLSPIFDNAKNTEGLYDYLIVCDERNNTPDVIDNNELKIDIYIKPVRTAEFILVSFYATRTGQDFNELIGG